MIVKTTTNAAKVEGKTFSGQREATDAEHTTHAKVGYFVARLKGGSLLHLRKPTGDAICGAGPTSKGTTRLMKTRAGWETYKTESRIRATCLKCLDGFRPMADPSRSWPFPSSEPPVDVNAAQSTAAQASSGSLRRLGERDIAGLAPDVDQSVPVIAPRAQEETPVAVDLGLDRPKHDFKAAASACPHVGSPVEIGNPTAASVEHETVDSREPRVWRCFHCDETFTEHVAAAEHFGASQIQEPACQINVTKFREMEALHMRAIQEDTDAMRLMHAMRSDHETALRSEEEKGYARGLRDGMKEAAHAARLRVPLSAVQKQALNPYHHSHGARVIWLNGFAAAELAHGIQADITAAEQAFGNGTSRPDEARTFGAASPRDESPLGGGISCAT